MKKISRNTAIDYLSGLKNTMEMLINDPDRTIKFTDPETAAAALASAVTALKSITAESRKGKFVRLGNGKRRWVPFGEAEKLLAVPRKDRSWPKESREPQA